MKKNEEIIKNEENGQNIQIITDIDDNSINYIFEIDKKIYTINALITNGTYGPIACFNSKKKIDEEVTIKKITNVYESPEKAKNILNQLAILCFLNNQYIIKLKDVYIPSKKEWNDLYLIEEYMGSNLERLILSNFDTKQNEIIIPWIIYQILMGLYYLHSSKIMHRNIKPSNILIDENCKIKICGFNNIRSFDDYENNEEINNFITEKGSLEYRAPEYLASKNKNKEDYNEKIDIWGVGCIMAELYTKTIPFFSQNIIDNKPKWNIQLQEIFYKLGKPSNEELKTFCCNERIKDIYEIQEYNEKELSEIFPGINDKKAFDLLQKLLSINPNKRISILEAVKHPYFEVINKYKRDDDFKEEYEVYLNHYGIKSQNIEKENLSTIKKIEFYKEEIEGLYRIIKE